MPQRISIGRMVGAVVAAGLIAATVLCALEYRRLDRAYYDWIGPRPVADAVDLSRPGTITAPFRQTHRSPHGEAFYLTVSSAIAPRDSRLLRGLRGTITITDAHGHEVESQEMTPGARYSSDDNGAFFLADLFPFADGEYTITINVDSGGAALKGMEQHIHARHNDCGMERYPALFFGFLAFVCGIPGVVIGLSMTWGFVKYGMAPRPRPAADTSGSGPSRMEGTHDP